MTRELETIFGELGLSQYLDAFIQQGFDAWDIILDIQESDLDALGVKLGHRRKLQRKIANARGISPRISLASPVNAKSDEGKQDSIRSDHTRIENGDNAGVTKRKYRRHPKPDENAPERPPSAYVLFSNKMREDLKSQNLSFTEIAKLVGENWQSLGPAEKDIYESQANAAKEKYHRDLSAYKKTLEYRKYAQYLHDFKERQAKQTQVHDTAKRPKLEPTRFRHGSSSSGITPSGTGSSFNGTGTGSGSGNGSGSERYQGSEPPPNRRERVNSIASMSESQHSSTAPIPMDEPGVSPRSTIFDTNCQRDPIHHPARRSSGWRDSGRPGDSGQHLPPLSDVLDDGKIGLPGPPVSDSRGYSAGFVAANHQRTNQDGLHTGHRGRIPALRHEASSAGSNTSGSSTSSFGRPLGDNSLPIHALLSNRSLGTPPSRPYDQSPSTSITMMSSPSETSKPMLGGTGGPRGYGFQSAPSAFQHMKVEHSKDGDVVMTQVELSSPNEPSPVGKPGFDGMSALLKAGEIVGRHGHQ